jgi:hypothetical protein
MDVSLILPEINILCLMSYHPPLQSGLYLYFLCRWGGGGGGGGKLSSYIIDGRFPKIFPETAKWGWLHLLESEKAPLIKPEQISY